MVRVENGQRLGFYGEEEVKYADILSGGEDFTMAARLSGGRDAMIETPFTLFQNKHSNYPIRDVNEDDSDLV